MNNIKLDELKQLTKNDLDLFEQKRLEVISSFLDSFANSPAITQLEKIQKVIDDKIAFQVVNKDQTLFEKKRQELMISFFNSLSEDSDKDDLLNLQGSIENKLNTSN